MDLQDTIRTYRLFSGSYDFLFGPVFHLGTQRRCQDRERAAGSADPRSWRRNRTVPALFRADSEVTGIDVSAEMLAKARHRVDRLGLENVKALLEMDAEKMSFPDNSFDAVLALYVASVVPNPARFAAEMRRVCRPGGTIVLVNHFASENGVMWAVEKLLAPLAAHDRLPCRFLAR